MFTITVQNITETAEKAVQRVVKEKGTIGQYPAWDDWED